MDSSNENEILEKFRAKLIEMKLLEDSLVQDNYFLLRWLRARDLNIEKATVMLKRYLDWRNHNPDFPDILSVLDGTWNPPDYVIAGMKYEITGFDNDGRPILWMPIGQHHTRKLCETGHRSELQRYTYYLCETILKLLQTQRQKGHNATQIVVILDMDELYFNKVAHYETIQFLLTFFKEFEAYYPEILHSAYVVNAAWVFSYIFAILKPILSSRTLGKVTIYSTKDSEWKPALLSKIPLSSLPKEYQIDTDIAILNVIENP